MNKTIKVVPTLRGTNVKNSNSEHSLLSNGIAATPVIMGALQILLPLIGPSITQKLTNEVSIQNNVREDQRIMLNKRADQLLQLIDLEEKKVDFNQDRINQWKLELDVIMEKQSELDNKNDGFLKFIFNKFIN